MTTVFLVADGVGGVTGHATPVETWQAEQLCRSDAVPITLICQTAASAGLRTPSVGATLWPCKKAEDRKDQGVHWTTDVAVSLI
jgi:hypothetical protein